MLCEVSSFMTGANNNGLKCMVRLIVKYSCPEVPGCCSSTIKYEVWNHLALLSWLYDLVC